MWRPVAWLLTSPAAFALAWAVQVARYVVEKVRYPTQKSHIPRAPA